MGASHVLSVLVAVLCFSCRGSQRLRLLGIRQAPRPGLMGSRWALRGSERRDSRGSGSEMFCGKGSWCVWKRTDHGPVQLYGG